MKIKLSKLSAMNRNYQELFERLMVKVLMLVMACLSLLVGSFLLLTGMTRETPAPKRNDMWLNQPYDFKMDWFQKSPKVPQPEVIAPSTFSKGINHDYPVLNTYVLEGVLCNYALNSMNENRVSVGKRVYACGLYNNWKFMDLRKKLEVRVNRAAVKPVQVLSQYHVRDSVPTSAFFDKPGHRSGDRANESVWLANVIAMWEKESARIAAIESESSPTQSVEHLLAMKVVS